jgi:hypothetical protein
MEGMDWTIAEGAKRRAEAAIDHARLLHDEAKRTMHETRLTRERVTKARQARVGKGRWSTKN